MIELIKNHIDVVIASLFLLWLFFPRKAPRSQDQAIRSLYGLGGDYRVIGADIGGYPTPAYVGFKSITGAPDSLLHSSKKKHWVVGEYKSRKYRGYIKNRELFQVTLYIGIVMRTQKGSVDGFIRYADKVVSVPYNDALFNALVAMVPEVPSPPSLWRPVDKRPLLTRHPGLLQSFQGAG